MHTRTLDTAAKGSAARDLAAVFRHRWWIAAACVLLIPAAVYVYCAGQPKTYQAKVIAEPEGIAAPVGGPVSNLKASQVLLGYAESGQVAVATSKSLHQSVSSVDDLGSTIDGNTGWLTLSATARAPRLAVDTANAYMRTLIDYVRRDVRRQLDGQISAARESLAVLHDSVERRGVRNTISALTAARDAAAQPVRSISTASLAVSSVPPDRNALLALILAVLISPPLILLVDRLDSRVRRPSELQRLTGGRLLSVIPPNPFTDSARRGVPAFQRLRDSLIYFDPDSHTSTVAIVSPLEREGRTTTAIGLAASLARAGKGVALVDADLRGPGLAARAGIPSAPGLSDVITGHDLDDALRFIDGFEGNLSVLPAGSTSPLGAELLGSPGMSRVLGVLSERCDFVVVDTAPVLVSSEALALVAQTSAVVVVARLHQTRRTAVRKMMRIATAAGARILGVVVTGARGERSVSELPDGAGRGPEGAFGEGDGGVPPRQPVALRGSR